MNYLDSCNFENGRLQEGLLGRFLFILLIVKLEEISFQDNVDLPYDGDLYLITSGDHRPISAQASRDLLENVYEKLRLGVNSHFNKKKNIYNLARGCAVNEHFENK